MVAPSREAKARPRTGSWSARAARADDIATLLRRVAERKLFFPLRLRLRLSKSFGSGAGSGSGNSLGTTCYHRFNVKKDIFHVFNERKST
jgi:hypothetical protein